MNQEAAKYKPSNGQLTLCTSLSDLLTGVQWKDQGTGTGEMHVQQLRRLVYSMALNYKTPSLTQRIEQSNLVTHQRAVTVITFLIIIEIFHIPLGAMMQSDRAILNVAGSGDLLNDRIDPSLVSVLDEIWGTFAKKNKGDIFDEHAGLTVGSTTFAAYVDDFIDITAIEGVDLEQSYRLWKKKYVMPSRSLKIAREFYGVGKYQNVDNEIVHFMMLWDGLIEGSSARTTHGKTTWTLGWNTAVALKYLEAIKGFHNDVLDAFQRQASWTWDEMKDLVKDFFVDFSFFGSLKGLIGENKYIGIKTSVYFEDADISTSKGVTSDVPNGVHSVNDLHSAGTLKKTINTSGIYPLAWAYAFIQSAVPDATYRLGMSAQMTIEEVFAMSYYSIFISTAADMGTSWTNNYRYLYNRIQMYNVVSAKNRDKKEGLMHADTQVVRMQYLLNHLDYTNYPLTALKNMVGLVDISSAPIRIFSASRPKNIDGRFFSYIVDFLDPENLREFISNIFGTGVEVGKTKPNVVNTNKNENKELDPVEEGVE
jgi:hypothetical protein